MGNTQTSKTSKPKVSCLYKHNIVTKHDDKTYYITNQQGISSPVIKILNDIHTSDISYIDTDHCKVIDLANRIREITYEDTKFYDFSIKEKNCMIFNPSMIKIAGGKLYSFRVSSSNTNDVVPQNNPQCNNAVNDYLLNRGQTLWGNWSNSTDIDERTIFKFYINGKYETVKTYFDTSYPSMDFTFNTSQEPRSSDGVLGGTHDVRLFNYNGKNYFCGRKPEYLAEFELVKHNNNYELVILNLFKFNLETTKGINKTIFSISTKSDSETEIIVLDHYYTEGVKCEAFTFEITSSIEYNGHNNAKKTVNVYSERSFVDRYYLQENKVPGIACRVGIDSSNNSLVFLENGTSQCPNNSPNFSFTSPVVKIEENDQTETVIGIGHSKINTDTCNLKYDDDSNIEVFRKFCHSFLHGGLYVPHLGTRTIRKNDNCYGFIYLMYFYKVVYDKKTKEVLEMSITDSYLPLNMKRYNEKKTFVFSLVFPTGLIIDNDVYTITYGEGDMFAVEMDIRKEYVNSLNWHKVEDYNPNTYGYQIWLCGDIEEKNMFKYKLKILNGEEYENCNHVYNEYLEIIKVIKDRSDQININKHNIAIYLCIYLHIYDSEYTLLKEIINDYEKNILTIYNRIVHSEILKDQHVPNKVIVWEPLLSVEDTIINNINKVIELCKVITNELLLEYSRFHKSFLIKGLGTYDVPISRFIYHLPEIYKIYVLEKYIEATLNDEIPLQLMHLLDFFASTYKRNQEEYSYIDIIDQKVGPLLHWAFYLLSLRYKKKYILIIIIHILKYASDNDDKLAELRSRVTISKNNSDYYVVRSADLAEFYKGINNDELESDFINNRDIDGEPYLVFRNDKSEYGYNILFDLFLHIKTSESYNEQNYIDFFNYMDEQNIISITPGNIGRICLLITYSTLNVLKTYLNILKEIIFSEKEKGTNIDEVITEKLGFVTNLFKSFYKDHTIDDDLPDEIRTFYNNIFEAIHKLHVMTTDNYNCINQETIKRIMNIPLFNYTSN